MGVHICLIDSISFADHPDWDYIRYAGDREFASLLFALPTVDIEAEDVPLMRPADNGGLFVWRQAIAAYPWPNPGRFEYLCALLAKHPNYWVHLSW